MSETFLQIYAKAAQNTLIKLVIIAIVTDTLFGVMRAIKEKKFNSCFGINGAIRKIAMIVTVLCMILVDKLVKVNLIGYIPEEARAAIGLETIGITEFFAILYIAYETVSILKNMALCGLPVKKVWEGVRKILKKFTDELPDVEEDLTAQLLEAAGSGTDEPEQDEDDEEETEINVEDLVYYGEDYDEPEQDEDETDAPPVNYDEANNNYTP